MQHIDKAGKTNADFWEKEVQKGGGHTLPWIDIDTDQLHRYIRGEMGDESLLGRKEPKRSLNMSPEDIRCLGDLKNKNVLCLSCGGGQQSAVFSLLGANVTVADITQGQLAGDQTAAAHYGYQVRTIQTDMRDLSDIDANAIDVVYGMTPCYVPSVRDVYAQVAKVLKPGGLYRSDYTKPALFLVGWGGGGYRIKIPYGYPTQTRADGAVEFRHYLDDIFNGLIDNGLTLLSVDDRARHKMPAPDAEPGSYAHECAYVGDGFKILAQKNGA